MREEKKTEIKVGITVLLGLILLALVYSWAKNISFGGDDLYIEVEFSTVAGLEIGDMVAVNGVRKGFVESIESGNNNAIVRIKFDQPVELMNDATFSIMMLDLMGGKKIEIGSGESEIPLDPDIRQKGVFAGDISAAMSTLYSVEGDLVKVIEELRVTLRNINVLFQEDEFTAKVKGSVENINELTENLNSMINENRKAFKSSIENIEKLSEQTSAVLSENKESIRSLIENMDSTLTASRLMIDKISQFSDDVNNSRNNLGKVLYDEDLLEDLKLSLSQIKEMTGLINEQLKSGGLKVDADVDLF
jgi:phospholipid/cholesterol/gamma-HCH transport system substrate-binding protein